MTRFYDIQKYRAASVSRQLAALLAALCLAAALGCSDDGGSDLPSTPDASGEQDTSDDISNNTPDGDSDLRDLPASVEVSVDPTRATYRSNTVVQVVAQIYNGHGESMGVQSVKWTVDPADAATAENSGYRLQRPGPVTFRACTRADGFKGEPVCGHKRIIVRDRAPTVEITSPEPGAWLGANGDDSVMIEGKVSAEFGELQAYLNGKKISLDSRGEFSSEFHPAFGINHVEVVVSDGLSTTAAEAMLDFIWAPAWYDTANTDTHTAFSFTDALVLDLGQLLFDDGQTPSQADESVYRTDDIADILSLFIGSIDFMDQIPNPVLDSSAAQLSILSLDFGDPLVGLELTDDGAELFVWVPDVQIATEGEISFDDQRLDLDGSITTDLAGVATLTMQKTGDDFDAEVSEISLSLQNAESAFAAPEANALFKLAESALRSKIEEILADTLREQFIDQLPELLANALNSVEAQLAGLSFDLETDFTEPLTLNLDGRIADFGISYREAMTAALEMDVSADKPPAFTHSPGIPLTSDYSTDLPLFKSSRAQVAVRLGLLNGLLHTLWESGFLEIDLTDLMPDQYAGLVQDAQLSAKLQPVLARPRAGEPYDFILSAGQMEITTNMLSQVDTYGINIEVGILMSLEDNAIAISVPDQPRVRAWIKSTDADEALIPKSTIESLLLGEVWPEIENTLRQGLSFDLPVPSFDGLADLAPSMSGFDVAFLLARPVSYRDGFIIFDIKLDGTLPR